MHYAQEELAHPARPPFGQLLKQFRTDAWLTQEALAERAGISTRSVRALEHGAGQPQRETAQRLASALALEGEQRALFLTAAAPTPRMANAGASRAPDLLFPVLPLPPTAMVGRSEETAAVAALLQREEIRLVTLTGAGGIGKTRLALQIARSVQPFFPAGVTFVGLASLSNPHLTAAAIASAFHLREVGTQPILTSLAAHLRDKCLLLLLDNFEHLVDAAPDIALLQRLAPQIKVLVTSRMPLHLQGEQLYPVPPLALPGLEQPASAAGASGDTGAIASIATVDAVQLFVQRAAMARPGFVLDASNAAAIAAITHLLDGLPLAIELAAARSAVLSPQALLQRLSKPLEILTGGPRDLPSRQQTLRDTIAWSFALLSPPEQALFRRLSVCSGGCRAGAAAVIACAEDRPDARPPEASDVIEPLLSLVEKNMLQAEEQPQVGARFTMLATMREFGREQLAAAGETEWTQRRHANFYLSFAERAAGHLQGAGQIGWLDQLDRELDNLRAALAWQPAGAAAGAALEEKLRVAGKLFLYWHLRGRYTEAITWLDTLLAHPAAETPSTGRAWALATAAALKASTGDNSTVYAQANEALAIARQLDDPQALANALHVLGTLDVALSPPDALMHEDSVKHLVEAVQLRRQHGDAGGTALSLDYMGFRLLRSGDYAGALSFFDEGRRLGQSLHDHWTTGMALLGMAEATWLLGDLAAAKTLASHSLDHHAALGDQHGSGHILGLLGDLAQAHGDLQAAAAYYHRSMQALQSMGEAPRNVRTLWAMAPLVAATGDPVHALQFAAAAVALSQTALVCPYTASDERLAAVQELAAHALSPAQIAAAWASGQTMTLDQAISLALQTPPERLDQRG